MIVDSMSKLEVMNAIRTTFDDDVLPYYNRSIRPKLHALILSRAQRENRTITLGWVEYTTSSGIVFKILKRGNVSGDLPEFIVEFFWKNRKCVAILLQNNVIDVFQFHCLERYAERVVKKNIANWDILHKYILKSQESAFQIVLPTPTHPYSSWLVIANALFLGDFEIEQCKHKGLNAHWYNTCISLNECHYTQGCIMHSFSRLQQQILEIGYNPLDIENRHKYFRDKNKLIKFHKELIIDFFSIVYKLFKLQRSFSFPFYEYFEKETEECMDFIYNELISLNIDAKDLDPFAEIGGIAQKGELDYKR